MPKKVKKHLNVEIDEFLDEVDAKLCNCAECGKVMLSIKSKLDLACSETYRRLQKHMPAAVAGKVNQRPYCQSCLLLWR